MSNEWIRMKGLTFHLIATYFCYDEWDLSSYLISWEFFIVFLFQNELDRKVNLGKHYMKSINKEWIKRDKRFNLSFDYDLLLFSDASLLVVWILFGFVDWTDLSEVVEPLDLLSEWVDSIDLFLDVPFDSALLWAIMEIYDTSIKGLKVNLLPKIF